jgi:hypothetical protein
MVCVARQSPRVNFPSMSGGRGRNSNSAWIAPIATMLLLLKLRRQSSWMLLAVQYSVNASSIYFFADETWLCNKSLLLGHVTVIKMFCIRNSKKINPRTMNIDTVEWQFGNARQMVGRSTNKLTAAGFDNADKKASTFNMANMAIVGNNSLGANIFASKKQY